jgi:hypothetical protein
MEMKRGLAARGRMLPAIALGLGLLVASGPGVTKQQPDQILTEDSRSTAVTRIGVPVEIRLRAQAGTGFSWVPTNSSRYLTPMPPISGRRAMPGSAQFQRFRFLSNRAGTFRLNFSYDQPWSGGTKGARTKNFIVVVRN